MRPDDIFDAIGNVSDELVEDAHGTAKAKKSRPWLRWGSLAAGIAVIAIASAIIIPEIMTADEIKEPSESNAPDSPSDPNSTVIHDPYAGYTYYTDLTEGREKNSTMLTSESGYIIYAWQHKTVDEKYNMFSINGITYYQRNIISEDLLDGVLGIGDGIGYDDINNQECREKFTAYKISGINENYALAVEIGGKYYIYRVEVKDDETSACKTLGELIDAFNLSETFPFYRFYEKDGTSNRAVIGGDKIWQILSEHRDAKLVSQESTFVSDPFEIQSRYHICFVVKPQKLGFYKESVRISDNGYIQISSFGPALNYYIGEEAAEEIISYTLKNNIKIESEPYYTYIVGTVTEIGDDYFTVDDSIICADENEGIEYRINMDPYKLQREIDFNRLKVGDHIHVTCSGYIDTENENTLIDVFFFDTDVTIFEDGNWIHPE